MGSGKEYFLSAAKLLHGAFRRWYTGLGLAITLVSYVCQYPILPEWFNSVCKKMMFGSWALPGFAIAFFIAVITTYHELRMKTKAVEKEKGIDREKLIALLRSGEDYDYDGKIQFSSLPQNRLWVERWIEDVSRQILRYESSLGFTVADFENVNKNTASKGTLVILERLERSLGGAGSTQGMRDVLAVRTNLLLLVDRLRQLLDKDQAVSQEKPADRSCEQRD